MISVAEYRLHAAECRKLARQLPVGLQREKLLGIAEHWDGLAQARDAQLRRRLDAEAGKPPPNEET
ncbi:hypothetical protein [Microvirga yunnanensis]|uniref:hypothetical protein n=1 Tax=Microvirga yunnanensis TaxID=2953740 RepID=UPI0021C72ABE|nr:MULTISPECIES: hypothetical protein [unclassified Microvirga]